ncbi:DUF4248 domain-containing protein [Fulvivirga sp. 29W222]|uniref:DUF4248 domain-containing protein n=1 Tax=Fulvivirga marina TaxID=2494733 RepID=A0A937KBB5_9BACT|nr:DUF4248 domain-containing protein [Fulvivirga marina]MBL6445714.1 DUF4248 domain-containing protein [Fulvivirga marina]
METTTKRTYKRIEAIELEESFNLKKHTLYKYELAELYDVDVKTMVTWMDLFIEKLERLGYHKHMKKLTPRMVRCIVEHLGEP